MKNYVDSSYNSSKKKDLDLNKSNNFNSESHSNIQNKEENNDNSIENENDSNNNKQTLINLKPMNIQVRNKNLKKIKIIYLLIKKYLQCLQVLKYII